MNKVWPKVETMADLIGKSFGRYHILEQLGEGGMAVVYKAYDTRLETDVAVKIIRTDNIPQNAVSRALKRFEREARALAKLAHPNIVSVTDYGEQDGVPYLVMKYLPGGTLKQKMGKPIPWQEAVQHLLPIAEALDYAHSQNMIHRDVKPSNILLTDRGLPMLTDFGIAKVLDLEETIDLTGTSAAVGTPEYMAPEQATAKTVDHRADIYALGVVLYEMITGRKPFIADTPLAVLFKHVSDPLPSPTKYVPDLPDGVEKVLLKALAKRPEDRYPSMDEMVKNFRRLLDSRKHHTDKPSQQLKKREIADVSLPQAVKPEPVNSKTNFQEYSNPKLVRRKPGIQIILWAIGSMFVMLTIGMLVSNYGNKSPISVPVSTQEIASETLAVTEKQEIPSTVIATTFPTPNNTPAVGVDGALSFTVIYISEQDGKRSLNSIDSIDGKKELLANSSFDYIDAPSTSPQGDMVAFETEDGIYTYNMVTHEIAERIDFGEKPVWHPDQESMAFGENTVAKVWICLPSPDDCSGGSTYAVPTGALSGNQIYMMPVQGSSSADAYRGLRGLLFPRWSPDGKLFSYLSKQNVDFICMDPFPLEDFFSEQNCIILKGSASSYDWSPKNDQIVYFSETYGNGYVYLLDLQDSNQKELAFNYHGDMTPVWSHAGDRIAYVQNTDGNKEIYVMTPDGLNQENITRNSFQDFSPIWSPDDKNIIFVSDRTGNLDLFMVNVQNGTLINLTDAPGNDFSPSVAVNTLYEQSQITTTTSLPGDTILPTEITDAKGLSMALVPAGEFMMGSNSGEGDEKPIHQVYLDAYYMDIYEVTNAAYKTCMDAGGCTPPLYTSSFTHSNYYGNPQYDDHPVIYVDWDQAKTYCEWRGNRLPTEAEWEKAARGTDGRTYPWGESINCDKANYNLRCVGDTTGVGSYPDGVSPYGLYDMAGNVWEWVNDWYDKNYYQSSPLSNPLGPMTGQDHVFRGGSWYHYVGFIRSAFRDINAPSYISGDVIGFRCAKDTTR